MTWKKMTWYFLVMVMLAAGDRSGLNVDRDSLLAHQIEQTQLAREKCLIGYTVTERYKVRNSHLSEAAEVVVNASYQQNEGKAYQVISREGPSLLQRTFMDRLLKEEADMSRGEAKRASLITTENYRMKWLGRQVLDGHNCDIVALEPREKNPHLLRGKAWVDVGRHNFIRLEGRPETSPSFWSGSPDIVRDYVEIGQFSYAQSTHATSHGFLLGRTDLTIEYLDYHLNVAPPE